MTAVTKTPVWQKHLVSEVRRKSNDDPLRFKEK